MPRDNEFILTLSCRDTDGSGLDRPFDDVREQFGMDARLWAQSHTPRVLANGHKTVVFR